MIFTPVFLSADIAPRSFDMDLHEGLFTMSLPRHQRSPLFDSNAAAAAATSTTGFKYGRYLCCSSALCFLLITQAL